MNAKTWIIFIAIVLSVVGGMVYLSTRNRLDVGDVSKEAMSTILPAEARNGDIAEHTLGNTKDPKVILIEYGDYQCPGCSTVAPETKQVVEANKDHAMLIFRNFPLPSLHPNARAAAAAAEAAGLQNKFWQMHSLLYQNQDSWKNASAADRGTAFRSYAEQLGLNLEQYDNDFTDARITKKIDFDTAIGRKHGVTGTPTIYLNGQLIELKDSDAVSKAVKEALNQAGVKAK